MIDIGYLNFTLSKGLAWQPVRREPMTLLAPSSLPGETPEALLRAGPLIRMDREAWTGRLINRYLRDQNFAVRELFELDAQEAIVILVAQGLGVTLLPDWGILPPAGAELRRIRVGQGAYDRTIGLVMARGARESLARLFAGALEAAAGRLSSAAEADAVKD